MYVENSTSSGGNQSGKVSVNSTEPPLHIASAANERYYPGLEVLVTSTLLYAAPGSAVHFHIFDGGISAESWKRLADQARRLNPRTVIHRLEFDETPVANFPALSGSMLTYARLFLGDALPQNISRVLYLDADIVICRDLEPLRTWDLQGRAALVAPDAILSKLSEDCPWLPGEESEKYPYFNAGVLVLDLDAWRKRGYLSRALLAMKTHAQQARFYDQTALNYVLRDDIAWLPATWNNSIFSAQNCPVDPCNFHLIAEKPWLQHIVRFDHYMWLDFYREVVHPHASWYNGRLFTGGRFFAKLQHYTARHPATRFIFIGILNFQLSRAAHEHRKNDLKRQLHNGTGSMRRLVTLRREWRARLRERLGLSASQVA